MGLKWDIDLERPPDSGPNFGSILRDGGLEFSSLVYLEMPNMHG